MIKFQIGDRIKNGTDTGVIVGKLRADGYYPVKLDRLAYLRGVMYIKPSRLKHIK